MLVTTRNGELGINMIQYPTNRSELVPLTQYLCCYGDQYVGFILRTRGNILATFLNVLNHIHTFVST